MKEKKIKKETNKEVEKTLEQIFGELNLKFLEDLTSKKIFHELNKIGEFELFEPNYTWLYIKNFRMNLINMAKLNQIALRYNFDYDIMYSNNGEGYLIIRRPEGFNIVKGMLIEDLLRVYDLQKSAKEQEHEGKKEEEGF
ncbi:MAG: hypothetical protein ACTSRR_09865 [Candidatus Heimdallarchaeaceae archaeon]